MSGKKISKRGVPPPGAAMPVQPALESGPESTGAGTGNPHFENKPEASPESNEKTLYLKLDADGNPMWSRMTPRTLDTWRTIFDHPSTGAQFSAQAIPPEDKGAKAADVSSLLAWLATGQAMLFSKITGLPLMDAATICAWTPDEKAALEPRAARLLNKYGGDVVMKYGDEIFFASALAMGTVKRFQTCRSKADELAHAKRVEQLRAAPEGEKKIEALVQ